MKGWWLTSRVRQYEGAVSPVPCNFGLHSAPGLIWKKKKSDFMWQSRGVLSLNTYFVLQAETLFEIWPFSASSSEDCPLLALRKNSLWTEYIKWWKILQSLLGWGIRNIVSMYCWFLYFMVNICKNTTWLQTNIYKILQWPMRKKL